MGLAVLLFACVYIAFSASYSTIRYGSSNGVARSGAAFAGSAMILAASNPNASPSSSDYNYIERMNPTLRKTNAESYMASRRNQQNERPDMQNSAAVIGSAAYNIVSSLAEVVVSPPNANVTQRYLPVTAAIKKMQKDMEMLDDAAGKTPQLSTIELLTLLSAVSISALSPAFFNLNIVEVLVPAMAALSASIGISAEYVGKVAISNGKEVAALAIQAAAEAEGILARAERTKAILPLCVGISTTASAFALLAPNLINELGSKYNLPYISEIYLVSPLVAVLSAAIAGLATQESQGLARQAIGIGNRRFASATSVGKTWLSATEQVEVTSARMTGKWTSFAIGVVLSPIITSLIPGNLEFKSIVCAAIAAAQTAYYLSLAEYTIACAADAVALKSRSAAVADTYANQGARAGSILPFTSALAGLCAAGSAAAVEFVPMLAFSELQGLLAATFPSGAALFAAAASVSKARCEVDAAAASAAAAAGFVDSTRNPYKDPIVTLKELIILTVTSSYNRIKMRFKRSQSFVQKYFLKYFFKKKKSTKSSSKLIGGMQPDIP